MEDPRVRVQTGNVVERRVCFTSTTSEDLSLSTHVLSVPYETHRDSMEAEGQLDERDSRQGWAS